MTNNTDSEYCFGKRDRTETVGQYSKNIEPGRQSLTRACQKSLKSYGNGSTE
jgi:hypothetical protein